MALALYVIRIPHYHCITAGRWLSIPFSKFLQKVLSCCSVRTHIRQITRAVPLQNYSFVSRAEIAENYHFLPFCVLRETKEEFCIIRGMLLVHRLTLLLEYHTTKPFASPWLIFARSYRLLALRCSR